MVASHPLLAPHKKELEAIRNESFCKVDEIRFSHHEAKPSRAWECRGRVHTKRTANVLQVSQPLVGGLARNSDLVFPEPRRNSQKGEGSSPGPMQEGELGRILGLLG